MDNTTLKALSTVLKDTVTIKSLRIAADADIFQELEQVIDPDEDSFFNSLRVDAPVLAAIEYADCVNGPINPYLYRDEVDGSAVIIEPDEEEIRKVKLARAFYAAYCCHIITEGEALEYMRTLEKDTTLKQFYISTLVNVYLHPDDVRVLRLTFKEDALVADFIEYEDTKHKFYLLEYNNLLNNTLRQESREEYERRVNAERQMQCNYLN